MNPPKNTQSLPNKVDLLVNKVEGNAVTLDQQQLMDLREDELNDLKTKIEQSQMEKIKKQETLIVIRNQQELLRLKTQLPNVPKPERTPSPEVAPPAETPVVENKTWDPRTWETKEWTNVGKAIGIGALVVGGLWLAGKAIEKIRGTTKTVSENAKSAWGTTKYLVAALTLTAVGYAGWNVLSGWKKSIDQVAALIQKAKELEETARNAPEVIRQEMEKKAQEFRQMADELREGKTKEDTPVPAPVATKEPTSTQKTVETMKETGKDIFIAKSILMFTEHANWKAVDATKERQIEGLLLLNRSMTMEKILDNPAGKDQTELYAMPDSDRESRELGASVLTDFCMENEDNVIRYLMNKENIDEETAKKKTRTLSLEDYAKNAVMGSSTIVEMITTLGDSAESLETKLGKMNMESIAQGNVMLRQELRDFIVEKADELGIDTAQMSTIDLPALFRAMVSGSSRATVADQLEKSKTDPAISIEDKIIQRIFEELNTDNTHLYILPCFHGIFPNEEGKTEVDRMKLYLMNHMSPAQALRIYLYRRMMDNGHAAGLALMQVEILKFIAEQDNSFFNRKKYEVILAISRKMLTATGKELSDEWSKLGININYPEMFEMSAKALGTLAGGMLYGLGKLGGEQAGLTQALFLREAGLATGTAIAAGEVGRKLLIWKCNPEHIKETLQLWASEVERQNLVQNSQNIGRRLALGPSTADILRTSEQYSTIIDEIRSLNVDDAVENATRTNLMRYFEKCLQSPRGVSHWKNLSTELSKAGLSKAAKAADAFSDLIKGAGMRTTFNIVRFSFGNGIITGAFSKALRTYDRGRSIVIEGVKKAPQVISSVYNSKFFREALAKSGDGAEALLRLIQSANMPTWLAEAFAKSARGAEMLINAAKSGGAPALQYLVKLGSYAKVAGKIAGSATVGIDVIICAVEMAANKARIAQEDNEAIKELYAMRDKISITNAAVGTAFSGTLLASAWAPAAAPFATMLALPLAGIFVTKYAHDELEAVSATWLSEEKDWAEKNGGSLLNSLETLGPGKVTFWQNLAAGNSRIETFHHWDTMSKEEFAAWQKHAMELPEKANEGQRFLATRAYVAQNTDMYPQQGETHEAFQQRFAEYQRLQIAYLGKVTQGGFDSKLMLVYRDAQTHAELKTLAKTLKENGQSQAMDVNGKEFNLADYTTFDTAEQVNGVTQQEVIGAYQKQSRAVSLMQLSVLKQMESSTNSTTDIQDQLLQSALLQEVRHDINACEKNMQNADFSGWQMTGYEEQTRDIARFVMNNALRILVREQADKLRTMDAASIENFESSVQTIRAFLQRDPVSFEAEAKNYNDQGLSGLKDALEKATNELREQTGNKDVTAGTSIFSDYNFIRSHLYLHPPAKRTQANI